MKRISTAGLVGVALFALLLTTGLAKQAGAEAIKLNMVGSWPPKGFRRRRSRHQVHGMK